MVVCQSLLLCVREVVCAGRACVVVCGVVVSIAVVVCLCCFVVMVLSVLLVLL